MTPLEALGDDVLGAHKGWAQCTACGRTFTATAYFDRHRAGPRDARTCWDPAELGLHEFPPGVWGITPPRVMTPEHIAARERRRRGVQIGDSGPPGPGGAILGAVADHGDEITLVGAPRGPVTVARAEEA